MPEGTVTWEAYMSDDSFPAGPFVMGESIQLDVISLTVTKEFWTPGDFTVTVPNDIDTRNAVLGSTGYVAGGRRMSLYRTVNRGTPVLMMSGIVTRVRATNKTLVVSGKGSGWMLTKRVLDENVYFLDVPATQVISSIVKGTGIELGATGADVPNVSCRFFAENKWRAAMDTAKNFAGWEAEVLTDDTINFQSAIGTDRSASFTMLYGYNVVSDGYRDIDFEPINTTYKVRGEGEGFNQIKVSAVNAAAEQDYWVGETVYDDRSIDNDTLAQNVANSRLSGVDKPRDQISLQTTDSFDPDWTLGLGDTVKVDWHMLSINQNMRIKKITYNWNGAETVNMDLGKAGRSIARAMAGTNPGIRQEVEVNARHPQGATNIWQINDHDNASSAYPLEIPFLIPDICLKVNKARLSMKPSGFRYNSKETESGGYSGSGDNQGYYASIGPLTQLAWNTFFTIPAQGVDTDLCMVAVNYDIYSYSQNQFLNFRLKDGNGNFYPDATGVRAKQLPDAHNMPYTQFLMATGNFNAVGISVQTKPENSDEVLDFTWSAYFVHPHSHSTRTGISTAAYDGDTFSVTIEVEKYNSGAWNTVWSTTSSFSDLDVIDYISSPNSEYKLRMTPNSACRLDAQLYIEGWVQTRD